jgi:hypothetical protein
MCSCTGDMHAPKRAHGSPAEFSTDLTMRELSLLCHAECMSDHHLNLISMLPQAAHPPALYFPFLEEAVGVQDGLSSGAAGNRQWTCPI